MCVRVCARAWVGVGICVWFDVCGCVCGLTTAAAEVVPLTEDKHTEHKLAVQKYNTWARTTLEARSPELDKEIARLQSEKQLVVEEQAEVVGFYTNAMTMLEKAAKAASVPTHVVAAAAPPAVLV